MFFLVLLRYHLKLSDRLHDLVLSDEVLVLTVKDQLSRSLRAAPSSRLLDFHHRTRPRNTCTIHIIYSIKVRINVILDLEAPAIQSFHPLSGW